MSSVFFRKKKKTYKEDPANKEIAATNHATSSTPSTTSPTVSFQSDSPSSSPSPSSLSSLSSACPSASSPSSSSSSSFISASASHYGMDGGTPSRTLALKKHMNAELMATMQARALAGSSGSASFSTPPNRAPPTSSGPTHHTGTSSAFRVGVPHLNTAPKDFVAGQVYPEGGSMGPAFSSGGHRDTRPSSGRTMSAQQESSEESLVVGTPGGSMIEFRSLPSHNKDPHQHHHYSGSDGAANNNNKGSWSLRLPPAPTLPEASTSSDSPADCNNDSEARVLPDEVRPRSTMTTMLPSVLPGLHHGQTRPVPPGKVNRRSSTITTPDAIHAANSLFELEATTAAADQANIFDERDSDSNILFTNDTNEGGSGDKQVIKGATIVKLVERLTFPAYPDPDFMIAFLMTYRSFTTATELFRLLMLRYNMPPPPNIAGEELEKWHKAVRTPVRLRVVNVLKAWLQGHVYDFAENSTLMETFKHFTCSVMRLGGDLAMAKAGAQLERIMERELEGKKKEKEFVFDHPPPASILTIAINPSGRSLSVDYNDLKFMDLHPLEIARQLTLIEFDLYQSIKPWECLNQAWTKADRLEKAPNIISMIERFNQVSNWVVTELVSETDETSRVNVLKRFIELANECKQINNFNACMEIISGLTNSSIYRLKTTWAALPTRTHELFESLHELMSRERNYQNFRAHLHTVDPPCIPYLGVYLTDLTFIEDGNQDLIPGTSLVNFVKRRKVASVIREIQQYQQTPYNFACVTFIQDFLQNLRQMSSDEAYNRSLAIIPRGASSKLTSKQLRESKARYKKKLKSEESKKDVKSFLKHREDSGHHGDHSPAPSSPSATACSSSSSNDLLGHNFDNLELEHQDGYRFYAKDELGKNIVLEETATNRPVIKAGTLEKLVERLTYAKYPDTNFLTAFLLTYRTFTTARELFDLLVMRFRQPHPKSISSETLEKWKTNVLLPVQLRVFNVLKTWTIKYWHESDDHSLVQQMLSFTDELKGVDGMQKAASGLKQRLLEAVDPMNSMGSDTIKLSGVGIISGRLFEGQLKRSSNGVKGGTVTSILSLSADEVAAQLAIVEHALLQAIQPCEFLTLGWSQSEDCLRQSGGKPSNAPNISLFLQHRCRVSQWVQNELLNTTNVQNRTALLELFLNIAEKSVGLKNYNAVAELINGLTSPTIKSMNAAWEGMSGQSAEIFENLKAIFQRWEKDPSKHREEMKAMIPPCVPNLALYLDELQRIDVEQPSLTGALLINFEKRQAIASIVLEIQQFQRSSYTGVITPSPVIQDYFCSVTTNSRANIESRFSANHATSKLNAPPPVASRVGRSTRLSTAAGHFPQETTADGQRSGNANESSLQQRDTVLKALLGDAKLREEVISMLLPDLQQQNKRQAEEISQLQQELAAMRCANTRTL